MKTFTDNADRVWTVSITVDAIRRVRATLDINLLEFIEGNLIQRFIRDPVLLCDVIYVICRPQADELNITDEDFGRAMAGDAIEYATTALLEDLVDFSPSPRDRANLQKVLTKTFDAMEKTRDAIGEKIEALDVNEIVNQSLKNASDLSGNMPALSESIPVP